MSDHITRQIRHARQAMARAVSERALAKSAKAERTADRHQRHARRALVEALRLADQAEG